ncbi:hypothetical protein [Acetonema longum]|uniref:Uncharacterized protein n=1 Tax=Acetonema longum DSM 6540 TaxID=1009370 RepID=F7NK42_9FIRM|nr:hypothetical protein [Acetonema longum]EGO63483.1 hypothetical protein ALO_12276 [Acetonema longum DSM 6540]
MNEFRAIVVFVVGVAVGAVGMYFGRPAELRVERVPVVTEKLVTVTNTEVRYVPKSGPGDADVEAKIDQPGVSVRVNDKPYQFSLLQDETQKFEQGKVSLQQTSDINLRIEIQPEDKTKKRSLGTGFLGSEVFGSIGYTPNNHIEYKIIGNRDHQGGMVELRF